MWPILNSFRERAFSQYICTIVDKKEILHTVSNTGICCTSDKVGIVYLVQYIFENSTINISVLCNMACCLSECLFTFPYVYENIHYVIDQFVLCIHFSSVYISLHSILVASYGIVMTNLIRESVIEMFHHSLGIIRRGSVMLKVRGHGILGTGLVHTHFFA